MLLFFCFSSYQELIRWLLLLMIWCPVCEELVFPVKVFSSLQKGQMLCSNYTGLIVNVFSCWECFLQSPLFLLPVLGTNQVSSPSSPLRAAVIAGVQPYQSWALWHLRILCLGSLSAHFMCLCLVSQSWQQASWQRTKSHRSFFCSQHLYITGTNNCLLSWTETTNKLPEKQCRYI